MRSKLVGLPSSSIGPRGCSCNSHGDRSNSEKKYSNGVLQPSRVSSTITRGEPKNYERSALIDGFQDDDDCPKNPIDLARLCNIAVRKILHYMMEIPKRWEAI